MQRMMQWALAIWLVTSISSVSGAMAAESTNLFGSPMPVGALIGVKIMDDGDWDPVDSQLCYGIRTDIGAREWPAYIALDATYSTDEADFGTIEVKGECTDLYLGARKYFPQGNFEPYIGGGLNWCKAEASARLGAISASADEDGIGFWVNAGVVVPINDQFSVGVDLKYSKTEIDMAGTDVEAGGFTPAAVIGFRF